MSTKLKLLIGLLLTILLSEAVLTGVLPHSRGYLFDLMEAKAGAIWVAIALYFGNYFFLDFFQAVKGYFVVRVSMLFREVRTKKEIKKVDKKISNVPQRIQEDIKLSYLSRITVWCEYLVSGIILVQLFYLNLDQPILLAAAMAYAAISVGVAVLFNPRLNHAEKHSQEEEATFRQRLIKRVSDIGYLGNANAAVIKASMIRTQYLLFTKLQLGVLTVLPYIVLIPSLFAGDITLGELVKHQATFSLIVVNASILIHYYTVLIQGKASEERVKEARK